MKLQHLYHLSIFLLSVSVTPIYGLLPDEGARMDEPHFRNIRWDMSANEVRAAESADYLGSDQGKMFYDIQILDYKATIRYEFSYQQLIRAVVIFYPFESSQQHIDCYNAVTALLANTHGELLDSRINWLKDDYLPFPDLHFKALEEGHLSFYNFWKSEKTKLFIFLSKHPDTNELLLGIEYLPINSGFYSWF